MGGVLAEYVRPRAKYWYVRVCAVQVRVVYGLVIYFLRCRKLPVNPEQQKESVDCNPGATSTLGRQQPQGVGRGAGYVYK